MTKKQSNGVEPMSGERSLLKVAVQDDDEEGEGEEEEEKREM